ncbi:MAG: hypothetical protein QM773_08680 [Hyphomonadaceae bacterium]
MRKALAAILTLATFAVLPGTAAGQVGGYGIGSGRASPADVAALARDIARVLSAEQALGATVGKDILQNEQKVLSEERQRQLLYEEDADGDGVYDKGPQGDLATDRRKWWVERVLQPALDIASNPAASCPLASKMLQRILVLERQAQVIGLDGDERYGDFGDGDSILGRAFQLLQDRCLAEAYDECLETGNGKSLIDFIAGFRMVELDPKVAQQAVYFFRRCTVYSIVYHLELDGTVGPIHETVVLDGSYRLLFESEGADALTRLATGYWFGPRPQDMMSPNVLLSSLNCGAGAVSCEIEDSPIGGMARGRLSLERFTHPQTFRIVATTELQKALGGRVIVEPEPCPGGEAQPAEGCKEGENLAAFHFEPPDFHAMAQMRPGSGPITRQGPSSDIYYYATGSNMQDPPALEEWTHEGYPLLFTGKIEQTRSLPGGRGVFYKAHVTGTFEIRHRPDLFPPEEIDAELEFPKKLEPPPRIPAQ